MLERINRKIYFFRLADLNEFISKIEPAIAAIAQLPFNDQGRYQSGGSEDTVLALFVERELFPIRIQFARIRRDNLPVVEKAGTVLPLTLEAEAGLMDCSHIAIFPDGIVAAEFNQEAPRIRRLGQYMLFKSGGILPSAPRFMPLFQKDVLSELENFPNVTILELEAHPSEADLIAEGDKDVGAAFKACKAAGASKKANLTLNSGRSGASPLKQLARRLFNNPSSRESLTKLKVVGGTANQRKPLDMLEEYLISTEGFLRAHPRSKAISSEDAYQVLERSYMENRHKFSSAAVANEPW